MADPNFVGREDDASITPTTQSVENNAAGIETIPVDPQVEETLKRDPFLVRFAPNDPENPFNWSMAKKCWIVGVYLVNTMWAVGLSSAYAPIAHPVAEAFGTSAIVSRLPLAVFLFGFSVGPLVLSPLGEDYGRRATFSVSLTLFYLLQIPCALAQDIGTLIAVRLLGGILASPMLNACGAVPDLWPSSARAAGWGLNVWALSAELIVLAPWVGALVRDAYGWRWIFWIALAVGGGLTALFALTVPETRQGVLLARKATRLRTSTADNRFYAVHERAMSERDWRAMIKQTCIRPVIMLVTEPIIFLFAFYDGVNYGLLYLAIEAGSMIFGQWGFQEPNVYLLLISIVIGYLLAFPCYYIQTLAVRYMEQRTGKTDVPEWKLIWGFFAAVLFPASLFMLAFTSTPRFHWIVPCVALAMFGTSSHILFLVVSDYVVDSYGHLASSAVTGQSFLREIMAGVLSLVADPFYRNMGYKWPSCIIAFIALALMAIPPLFYIYGPEIRKRSRWYAELKHLEHIEREYAELDLVEQKREQSESA